MARRTLAGNRVLITGASSGIGRALTLELARRGAKLVAVARRAPRLESLAREVGSLSGELDYVVGDITEAEVRQSAVQRSRERYGGLDTLVNNAGVGAHGFFAEADEARLRRIMEVNFFALAALIREALPTLRHGTCPLIVNVSSIVGHRAVPRVSEYCASKFAVQGLSEALRAEFAPLGIDLLVVSPGTTQSEFFENLLEAKSETLWPGRPRASAASVARQIARAMRQGRGEIIPSWSGRLFCWLNRLSPALLDHYLARAGRNP